MKRRTFLKSSLVLTSVAGLSGVLAPAVRADDEERPQYYELRTYHLRSGGQRQLVDDYWRRAAIPALNRLGIRPVGAFVPADQAEPDRVYVLVPYDSLAVFGSLHARLAADRVYQAAGADYLDRTKPNAAYERFDSALLVAFEHQKRLQVPASLAEGKPWLFELRTYTSPSVGKGDNKVRMFNSGEVALMHRVGLHPVFFGQALIGTGLPHLTYMLSGPDRETHQRHWKAFFGAPVWKQLIGDPQYRGNVSHVSSHFLTRTAYSQI